MPEVNELYPGPPGSVLQDARVNAGKSVVDVAEALNLLKTYVEALENNDYSRFNSPLFARGYIKSYARYMGLEEEPLLRDCDRICRRQDDKVSHRKQARVGAKAPARGGVAIALVAALLIWSLSVWLLSGTPTPKLSLKILPDRHAPLTEINGSSNLGESLLKGENALVVTLPVNAQPEVTHSATVSLTIHDAVWLELRDARNIVVLSGTQPRGKQISLSMQGPISFSVAYWPAVTMQYNGKAVALEALAQSKAVRLQVGEL